MSENILFMRKAKEQLSNLWVNVAIGTLIYLAINTLVAPSYLLLLLAYGPLTFGYYLYIACNVDTKQNNFNLIFKGFERFVDTFIAGLLFLLAVTLGTFLLIVPGIIVALGLSMTFFIMVDDPNVSGSEAISQSWNMMKGHKWEFFCLNLRFFGWMILSCLTCGIGWIFLTPYITATQLNFYRRLKYGVY